MNYYVIGEEDVVLGFRYAGISGIAVNTAEEAYEAIRKAQQDKTIGIIILQDSFSVDLREIINEIRMTSKTPLLVEIPGPGGRAEGRPTLLELIQEAVGIKV